MICLMRMRMMTAPVPRKIDETKTDVDNDYENSRENYYNLIDKGNVEQSMHF